MHGELSERADCSGCQQMMQHRPGRMAVCPLTGPAMPDGPGVPARDVVAPTAQPSLGPVTSGRPFMTQTFAVPQTSGPFRGTLPPPLLS